MPTAWFISWRQRHSRSTSGQNLSIAIGFLISTVGFGKKNYFVWPLKIFTLFLGLLNLLNENSPMLLQTLFPLISGIGMGILFHAPYQVFGKAFKPSELATCTSAFFLVRFTGATVGLVCLFVFPSRIIMVIILQAVAGAVFDARMASRITSEMGINLLSSSVNYGMLKSIQPLSLRAEVLHIVSTSIQVRLHYLKSWSISDRLTRLFGQFARLS